MVPGLIEFWEQTLRDGEQAVKSSSHLGRRNSQGWKRVPLKPSTIPFTVTMILGWQLRILWPRGSLVSGAPQTTVCGIGERSGNAAFEEVCLGSGSVWAEDRNQDGADFRLAEMVEKYSRVPIPVHKPVVGTNPFAHEARVHIAALLRNPQT